MLRTIVRDTDASLFRGFARGRAALLVDRTTANRLVRTAATRTARARRAIRGRTGAAAPRARRRSSPRRRAFLRARACGAGSRLGSGTVATRRRLQFLSFQPTELWHTTGPFADLRSRFPLKSIYPRVDTSSRRCLDILADTVRSRLTATGSFSPSLRADELGGDHVGSIRGSRAPL